MIEQRNPRKLISHEYYIFHCTMCVGHCLLPSYYHWLLWVYNYIVLIDFLWSLIPRPWELHHHQVTFKGKVTFVLYCSELSMLLMLYTITFDIIIMSFKPDKWKSDVYIWFPPLQLEMVHILFFFLDFNLCSSLRFYIFIS